MAAWFCVKVVAATDGVAVTTGFTASEKVLDAVKPLASATSTV
jgi:hypothetical protein